MKKLNRFENIIYTILICGFIIPGMAIRDTLRDFKNEQLFIKNAIKMLKDTPK